MLNTLCLGCFSKGYSSVVESTAERHYAGHRLQSIPAEVSRLYLGDFLCTVCGECTVAWIDETMMPVVQHLTELGIHTQHCCEGLHRVNTLRFHAYITFRVDSEVSHKLSKHLTRYQKVKLRRNLLRARVRYDVCNVHTFQEDIHTEEQFLKTRNFMYELLLNWGV